MKVFRSFIRWCPLYFLVILTIIACFWENSLPITTFNRSLLLIGTLIISGIVIESWISSHPAYFSTPMTFHEGLACRNEKIIHSLDNENHLEKRVS